MKELDCLFVNQAAIKGMISELEAVFGVNRALPITMPLLRAHEEIADRLRALGKL